MRELDERILITRRSINAKAFGYTYFALWGIIIYRMFVLHQTPNEYTDIMLLTIGLSVYVVVNNINSGVFHDTKKKSKNKVISLLFEPIYFIGFIFVFRFLTGIKSIDKLIVVTLIVIILRFSPFLFNKLSNWIINKKLKDE